ncbi:unnamed protein product, partial [Effrenium voratum]
GTSPISAKPALGKELLCEFNTFFFVGLGKSPRRTRDEKEVHESRFWRRCCEVYENCQAGLPNQFLAFLDTSQAEDFRGALFSPVSGPGQNDAADDYVCDVRIHGTSSPFGELVMRTECPIDLDAGSQEAPPKLMSDVLDERERRVACSVGEALATSQRLAVPALVCVAYLLRSAKTCIDKALLEGAFCRVLDDDVEECDMELLDLSDRLGRWTVEASQGTADATEGGLLLQDLNAFAWYWIFSQSALPVIEASKRDWRSFGDFRRQYQQVHAQFPF